MIHGDKRTDAGPTRPPMVLLEPLFTGAPRARRQTRGAAGLLPPLRLEDPARFPSDSAAEPYHPVGHGDPLRAFVAPAVADSELGGAPTGQFERADADGGLGVDDRTASAAAVEAIRAEGAVPNSMLEQAAAVSEQEVTEAGSEQGVELDGEPDIDASTEPPVHAESVVDPDSTAVVDEHGHGPTVAAADETVPADGLDYRPAGDEQGEGAAIGEAEIGESAAAASASEPGYTTIAGELDDWSAAVPEHAVPAPELEYDAVVGEPDHAASLGGSDRAGAALDSGRGEPSLKSESSTAADELDLGSAALRQAVSADEPECGAIIGEQDVAAPVAGSDAVDATLVSDLSGPATEPEYRSITGELERDESASAPDQAVSTTEPASGAITGEQRQDTPGVVPEVAAPDFEFDLGASAAEPEYDTVTSELDEFGDSLTVPGQTLAAVEPDYGAVIDGQDRSLSTPGPEDESPALESELAVAAVESEYSAVGGELYEDGAAATPEQAVTAADPEYDDTIGEQDDAAPMAGPDVAPVVESDLAASVAAPESTGAFAEPEAGTITEPEFSAAEDEDDSGASLYDPDLGAAVAGVTPSDEAAIHDPEPDTGTPLEQGVSSFSGSASSAAEAEPYAESSVATADEADEEVENEDWRDEALGTALGQAEPEDELPLLDTPSALSAAVERGFPGSQLASAARTWPDPARLDRMADRLEEIARSLRRHEAAGSLIAQARDPLGALIIGYLLGYFEGRESRDEDTPG